jgi:hypothetical protein
MGFPRRSRGGRGVVAVALVVAPAGQIVSVAEGRPGVVV